MEQQQSLFIETYPNMDVIRTPQLICGYNCRAIEIVLEFDYTLNRYNPLCAFATLKHRKLETGGTRFTVLGDCSLAPSCGQNACYRLIIVLMQSIKESHRKLNHCDKGVMPS